MGKARVGYEKQYVVQVTGSCSGHYSHVPNGLGKERTCRHVSILVESVT
jgi:hypothetical protein